MPDGSPQLTQTWVSTDGVHILIHTPDHSQKARNVAREPHAAVNVVDPDNTMRYFAVRGRVIATTTRVFGFSAPTGQFTTAASWT